MNKRFLFCFTFLVIIFLHNLSHGAYLADGIESFPDTYKPYLYVMKEAHPNWNFKVLYTGLNWSDVINNEYANGSNLVPLSYSDSWKCKEYGLYNVQIDRGWVNASREAVEYFMDTRNFLNDRRIFQFELLAFDDTNTLDGIEKILYGTEFYNRTVSYKDSYGNQIDTDSKYSELILNAGRISRVSCYNLASRIKQEMGYFLSNNSISGTFPGYEGYYNFYNIGATSSTEENGAIRNGLEYAKNGKNASEETKNKYYIPWISPARAITGGAIFIGNSYIAIGQYNLYLQKFDVNNDYKTELYRHQYMTNCFAPYSESYSIWNAYNSNGLINENLTFVIPVYDNMPKYLSSRPDINKDEYIADNTRVFANVTTALNIRSGPSLNYESVCKVLSGTEMTRISKGNQNGERWDRVILDNGIEGYAFQEYLTEVAENVDNIYVNFDNRLKIDGNIISNIDYTVSQFYSLIDTNLVIEIYNNKNKLLSDNKYIGTGSKLVLKNGDNIVNEYYFIKYGDVNGDGIINSLDVLVLQKHILEIKNLTGVYLKAGNISKNGKLPSALDILKIQKHILEIKFIEQ